MEYLKNKNKLIKLLKICLSSLLIIFVYFYYNSAQVYSNNSRKNDQNSTVTSPLTLLPEIKFDYLSMEDGLDENSIVDILQTEDGYVWIITQFGLHRYDGYDFKLFQNNPDDPSSLPDGLLINFEKDFDDNLWIGMDRGLVFFDRNSNQFTKYLNDKDNSDSISGNSITDIMVAADGTIWIGTLASGLNSYSTEDNKFTRYRYNPDNPNSISSDHITSLVEDSFGNIWIGTSSDGLNKLNLSSETFTSFKKSDVSPNPILSNDISTLFIDDLDNLWIGTLDSGLLLYDIQNNFFYNNRLFDDAQKSIPDSAIVSINQDHDGSIWAGTWGNGLFVINLKTGLFGNYSHDVYDNTSLSNDIVQSILIDNSGILWFGTEDKISLYDKFKHKFFSRTPNPSDSKSVIGGLIFGIEEDAFGNLYILSRGFGMDYYDMQTGDFTHFFASEDGENGLSSLYFQSLLIDSSGDVWIGTWDDGLIRFNPETGIFKTYKNDPSSENSLGSNIVWGLLEDSEGDIWIGSHNNSLDRYIPESDSFEHFVHNPDDPTSINSNEIVSINEDSEGLLWIGTYAGLNTFDKETDEFRRFVYDENDPDSVEISPVVEMAEDSSNNIWLATINGVIKYNKQNETYQHFTENDGLPSNIITAVQIDYNGNLWFATFGGISFYDPVNEIFKNYTVSDGLPTDTCRVSYQSSDGEIFFGNQGGFVSFYPEDIVDNTFVPQIVLSDFLILNKSVEIGPNSVLKQNLSKTNEIMLDYEDTVFSIDFASLHFSDPKSNQYAYILEGFDEEWTYTTSDYRRATYTNLEGGEYTFRVKGSNSDGVWNEEGVSLKIIISSPIWDTIAFKIFIAIFIISLLVIGVRSREASNSKRRFELENLVEQKTIELKIAEEENIQKEKLAVLGRISGTVSHELRNPLSVISNAIYYLQNAFPNVDDKIKQYHEIISHEANVSVKIISDLLNYSKENKPQFDVVNISETVMTCIDRLSKIKKPNISIVTNFEPKDICAFVDPVHLELALRNLISNAYQAMENGGVLTISSFIKNNKVILNVSDTGSGISKMDFEKIFTPLFSTKIKGFGLGLSVTKRYIEANNGTLTFESELGKGTTFTITLSSK